VAIKNQAFDLPEFLQHHYFHIGIKRYYIMDDGSTPPLADSLENIDWGGVPRSAVTFIYWSPVQRMPEMQNSVYNECVRLFGYRHTWMAFIDVDEFFEMTADPPMTLTEFLLRFEDDRQEMLPINSTLRGMIGAVGVNWRMHNSNGLQKRPPQGMCRKSFTSCIWDDPNNNGAGSANHHIKSIVRTKWYDHPITSHFFQLHSNKKTVGELGDLVLSSFRRPITRKYIGLHHYVVKSKEEFEHKLKRGDIWNTPKNWMFWNGIMNTPNNTCDEMVKYKP
jgi:hypothetical protein